MSKSNSDDDFVDLVVEVPHGLAHASERLGVAVVVQADGLAASGMVGATSAASRFRGPRPVVADLFD